MTAGVEVDDRRGARARVARTGVVARVGAPVARVVDATTQERPRVLLLAQDAWRRRSPSARALDAAIKRLQRPQAGALPIERHRLDGRTTWCFAASRTGKPMRLCWAPAALFDWLRSRGLELLRDWNDDGHRVATYEGEAMLTPVSFKTSTAVGWILIAVTIVVCAAIAIVVHAALPAKVDEELLDGVLVLRFGFPAVAVAYFLILFAQCSVSVAVSWSTAQTPPLRHGLTLGLAFAVLYIIGVQEIMVETSPFPAWGSDFVVYQAIIGLGDAIPVIILCAITGALLANGRPRTAVGHRCSLAPMLAVTLTVGTVRWAVSALGIIQNCLAEYPTAVVAWGYLLGLGFGIGYVLLRRTNQAVNAVVIFGVGLNWLVFNSFIGLVFSGTMADALLRGAIDAFALGLSITLLAKAGRFLSPGTQAGERAGNG